MPGPLRTVVSIITTGAPDEVLSEIAERLGPYGGTPGWRSGVAHFDAPADAVRFARAVREATRAALHRTGIDVGSDQTGSDPEEVSAALAAYARPGEILVTDVVRRLAGSTSGTHYVDRGRVRPPGLDDRLQLHALASGSDPQPASPLFGRADELAVASELLDATTAGQGTTIVVEGDAGIGKSHLSQAISKEARERELSVLTARADELGMERAGLLTSLAANVGVVDTDPARTGDDPAFALIEHLVDAVQRAATAAPLLVIAEDLHWADDTSLRALTTLARAIEPMPVCLLVTLRPTPRSPALERSINALGRLRGEHLCLEPLGPDDTNAVATARLGAVPGDDLRRLLARTCGNPLHATELLRSLEDDGSLHIERGVAGVRLADPGTAAQPSADFPRRLDDDLTETVRRRLSSMPTATTELLRLASLLGTTFTLHDLATVSSRRIVDVARDLNVALDAGLVDGDSERLAFHHDLVREGVYESIAPAIRRDLHSAAGRALAAAGAPARDVAGQFSVGARVGDDVAIGWLTRAAEEGLRFDSRVTIDLYRRILELLPDDDVTRRDTTESALVEVLASAGRVHEAMHAADDLLSRARAPDLEFTARRARVATLATIGDLTSAAAECRRAAAISHDPDAGAALRCAAGAMDVIVGGDIDAAITEAREVASSTERTPACWAEQTLGIAALAQARYADAHSHLHRSRVLLEAGYVAPLGFLLPHSWEAGALGQLDRFAEALAASHRARTRAETRGEISSLVQATTVLALVHFLTGDWDDALAELAALRGIADETGAEPQRIFTHGLMAAIAFERGDRDETATQLALGHALVDAGTQHLFGIEMLIGTAARFSAEQGDLTGARSLLELMWNDVEPLAFLLQFGLVVPDLVALRRADGDAAGALEIAEHIAAADQGDVPTHRATALRCMGLATADPDVLLCAVDAARLSPRVVNLVATMEDAARALVAGGRPGEATVLIEEAFELLAPIAADAWIARFDALSGNSRAAAPARATHGWHALSPKEHEVVALVTEGLSNPEIAERLFISRRTVESHLSHVFRKLDLSNRTQLAREALERSR